MKLVYITSQKYPSSKADPFFWRSMAEAFAGILGNNFIFVVRDRVPEDLKKVNALPVNAPKKYRTLYYCAMFPLLVARHEWNDRDVVFFTGDPYLMSVVIFWKRMLRLKYRICSDWHQLFGDWKDAYITKRSDYLITTSERLKRLIAAKFRIEPRKIKVAYGGVDPVPFEKKSHTPPSEYRRKLGLPVEKILIGYVGAFRALGLEKGIETMIRSLALLDSSFVMVFVGGRQEEIDHYRALAEKEGVAGRCIFVIKQPFEKVIEYEMAMDALVIPYPDEPHFRDYGFPMKVWEYMAAQRPIIYSDLEIMAEVLGGKAAAFTPDDPRSLSDAILRVQSGMNLPGTIKPYTWDDRARTIINFLQT